MIDIVFTDGSPHDKAKLPFSVTKQAAAVHASLSLVSKPLHRCSETNIDIGSWRPANFGPKASDVSLHVPYLFVSIGDFTKHQFHLGRDQVSDFLDDGLYPDRLSRSQIESTLCRFGRRYRQYRASDIINEQIIPRLFTERCLRTPAGKQFQNQRRNKPNRVISRSISRKQPHPGIRHTGLGGELPCQVINREFRRTVKRGWRRQILLGDLPVEGAILALRA